MADQAVDTITQRMSRQAGPGPFGSAAPVREKSSKVAERRAGHEETLTVTRAAYHDRPVVTGELLLSSEDISFAKFLLLPQTHEVFGTGDSGRMPGDVLRAREFHYFGSAAGKFSKEKARAGRALTQYVRRAYGGSDRGIAYRACIAKPLWLSYEKSTGAQVLGAAYRAMRAGSDRAEGKARNQRGEKAQSSARA